MKKLLLAAALLFSVQVSFAQSEYAKKVEKSNEEIANPKKQSNPKTWIARGDLFREIAEAPMSGLQRGQDAKMVGLFLKGQEPTGTESFTSPEGAKYSVTVYPDKKLYYNAQGQLEAVLVTKTEVEEPLQKSYEAYEKAIELGGDKKAIKADLEKLNAAYFNYALAEYTVGNFPQTQKYFQGALACTSNPVVGVQDTSTMYNVGFVALKNKDFKTAEKYFSKAEQLGYTQNGEIYGNIYESIAGQGDSTRATEVLMESYKKYPENLTILSTLINHYLKKNEDPKVILPIIHNAQKGAPTNASLYNVEGNLYNQLKDEENALKAYNKAIELDPKSPNSYYAIGLMYYNNGANAINEANNTTDQAAYDALVAKAQGLFKKSIDPFEKAYSIDPSEKAFADALKTVYYRFREDSPEMQANYEKYKKISEE